jgi:hypothetical protein
VPELFAAARVHRDGVVRWGTRIPAPDGEPGTGIYIVALTADTDTLGASLATCPLSTTAVRELLDVRRELKLDGLRPNAAAVTAPELARRLGVSPKTLRAWLRSQAHAGHPLVAGHERYGRWWFTEPEARQLADEYRRRR